MTLEDDAVPAEAPDDAHSDATTANGGPVRRRALGRAAGAVALVAVLAGAVVSAAVAFGGIAPDPLCSACHEAEAEALGRSPHAAGADCYDCHSAPDVMSRSARMARDVSAVFRMRQPAEASVDDGACRSCHEALAKAVESRGLKMSHETCLTNESRCTDCHSDTGHGTVAPGRGIDMDTCARCHDGEIATMECDACHLGKRQASRESTSPWAVTHGPNWKQTHGMGELPTCRACHDREDCSRCHMPVPHGKGWPSEHGAAVIAGGRDKCTVCHVPKLCDGCHGTTMPHPSGWLASHPTSTTQEQSAGMCRTCHVEADCTGCHEMHVHPGIPADVLERMRRR